MAKSATPPVPMLQLTTPSDGKCILVNVTQIASITPGELTLTNGKVVKFRESYETILATLAKHGIGIVFGG